MQNDNFYKIGNSARISSPGRQKLCFSVYYGLLVTATNTKILSNGSHFLQTATKLKVTTNVGSRQKMTAIKPTWVFVCSDWPGSGG